MKVNPRELVLAVLTFATALYAGLIWLGYARMNEVQRIQIEIGQLRESISASRDLLAERERWAESMAARQALMPVFPMQQRMDVHWLSVIESMASRRQLQILRHEPGEERQDGPVFELPVFVRQWEGTLDALVYFLFDLEQEGAMLDVRYLHIRPKDATIRHGRLDLFCAYRRES